MKTTTSSVVTLSLLAGLVAATPTVFAQATEEATFPLPANLPAGTKVSLGGSPSLEAINKGMQDGFTKKFPGSEMPAPAYTNSQKGVDAVQQGKLDIAGIGRPLTEAEKAKGLGAKSLGSRKIVIVVGEGNPFANGDITFAEFAKIYRGEITDWSQIKGSKVKGKIKVVDLPETSDTRQAFGRYPIFKSGVKTGSNAVKLTEDNAKAVSAKLGKDGIGYMPVTEMKGLSGIKALSMHKTQPDNPKYPFSQPMSYVYKKDGVSEGAKAFLGYAGTPEAAAVISAAGLTPATGGAAPATTGDGTASTAPAAGTTTGESPATGGTAAKPADSGNGGWPWWLIPLGLIGAGAGAWMLLGGKKDEEEETEPRRLKPLYSDDAPAATGTTGLGAKTGSTPPMSGDLSGTISGTVNSAVDTVKDRSGDLLKGAGAVGGAALAGGAAIAGGLGLAKGKGSDSEDNSATLSGDLSGELPRIDVGNPLEGLKSKVSGAIPDVNLANPLDGIKDKVSDLTPDLGNPLEGLKDKVGEVGGNLPDLGNPLAGAADRGGDLLKGLGVAGAGAVAGGAALAGGLLGKKDETESRQTPDGPATENKNLFDSFGNPLEGLKDKASDLLQGGKDAGGAALAGGAAVVGGTAAAASQGAQSFFGGGDDDQSGELSLENAEFETPISALHNPNVDPFDDSILSEPSAALDTSAPAKEGFNPLDVIGEFKERAMDKAQDLAGSGGAALAGGAAAAAALAGGAGAAAKSFFNAEDQSQGDAAEGGLYSEGQITLVSPNPAQAYVHWDVPVKLKRQLRQQGGKKLAVRMYDVTDLDISQHLPSNFQEFECDELAWDLHLPVPKADRQYLVEIGYVSESNSWLMLARSAPVLIASEAK
jgi:phosphate transport system substrate-binding protein